MLVMISCEVIIVPFVFEVLGYSAHFAVNEESLHKHSSQKEV